MQVGEVASERSKAKIFSEEHHLAELEKRISYEEDAFAAKRRGQERPIDYFTGGQIKTDTLSSRQTSDPLQGLLFRAEKSAQT